MNDNGNQESGYTLLETMVAVMVLAIAATGILTAIVTAIAVTHDNRTRAEADRYGRILAEQVKGVDAAYAYKPCAVADDYPSLSPVQNHGWRVTVEKVEYGVPPAPGNVVDQYTSTGCTPANDSGVQRVTVLARPPEGSYRADSTKQRIFVIKRDTGEDCNLAVQPRDGTCY